MFDYVTHTHTHTHTHTQHKHTTLVTLTHTSPPRANSPPDFGPLVAIHLSDNVLKDSLTDFQGSRCFLTE